MRTSLFAVAWIAAFLGGANAAPNQKVPAPPTVNYVIVGFYGAIKDGGTFVRTVEEVPVKQGDRIRVTGTGIYD